MRKNRTAERGFGRRKNNKRRFGSGEKTRLGTEIELLQTAGQISPKETRDLHLLVLEGHSDEVNRRLGIYGKRKPRSVQ